MPQQNTPRSFPTTLAVVIGVVVFFHIWQLGSIPRGIFVDAGTIGYNAASIVETGRDEYGEFMPLFFKSFGDYFGPLPIYSTAAVFTLFGISIFSLVLTSVIFYFFFFAGFILLVNSIFKRSKKYFQYVLLYAAIAAGFLPWLFPISRVAHDASTVFAPIMLALFFTYQTFHSKSHKWYHAALAGLFATIPVYSYQIGKFLGPALLISIIALYFRKQFLGRMCILILTASIIAGPYIYFSTGSCKECNLHRFRYVSYVLQELPLEKKVDNFFQSLRGNLDPEFLLLKGGQNKKYSTQFAGELFWTVFFLSILGLLTAPFSKRWKADRRFVVLLSVNLPLSLIPAVVTVDVVPHSLRSMLFAVYVLIFSCFGFAFLCHTQRRTVVILVMVALITEAFLHTRYYFTEYPENSRSTFGSYGLYKALEQAISLKPREIFVSDTLVRGSQYANLEFFWRTIHDADNIAMSRTSLATLAAEKFIHSCVISIPQDTRTIESLAKTQADIKDTFFEASLTCFSKK